MSFFGGDLATQQHMVVPPSVSPAPQQVSETSNELKQQQTEDFSKSVALGKRQIESHPFVNQFSEVEKAIANFTKHQPFNHHYAPNVHPNRNHNNHYNNRFNNNNNMGNNNGRFHNQQQQQLPIVQQFKNQQQQQQIPTQQQQFFNGNAAGLQNRFQKLPVVQQQQPQQQQQQQQQQPLIQQQYLLQHQQLQQLQQQQQVQTQQQQQLQPVQQFQQQSLPQTQSQPQFLNNNLKFDMYQQPQEIPLSLRNSSPTFSAPMRPSSVNSSFPMSASSTNGVTAPLEQINTGSSFGLSGSDLISTPISNPVIGGVPVDKNISLDDSTTYLGDLWGNSKNLRSSTSVWA